MGESPESSAIVLSPRSVAVIGATERPGSIGARITRHVLEGGFQGDIFLVNPHYESVFGRACLPSIEEIDASPELCVLLVPTGAVLEELRKCAERGVRAAIVIAAGHEATDYEAWLRAVRGLAEESGVRVYGPNTVGLVLDNCGLHASFVPMLEHDDWRGDGAIITQSGGLAGPFHIAAVESGRGIRYLIGTGTEVNATACDFIEAVLADAAIGYVATFVEGCADAWRLGGLAATARQRGIPMLLLKGGRSAKGRLASLSHTGKSSSSADIYRDLCRELGIVWVEDEISLRIALQALPVAERMPGNPAIACVAASGGICTLLADYCDDHGVQLAELSDETRDRLSFLKKWGGSNRNPVDASAQLLARSDFFQSICDAVEADKGVDLVVFSATARLVEQYQQQIGTLARQKPVILACVGRMPAENIRRKLSDWRVPIFANASEAIKGIALVKPFAAAARSPASRRLGKPRTKGRSEFLSPEEGMRILDRTGVSPVKRQAIGALEEISGAAGSIGFPMVLKIYSAEIPHKAAAGGLVIGIRNGDELRDAFIRLEETAISLRLAHYQIVAEPQLEILREIAIGIFNDPEFGPLLMVARGGRDVESTREKSYGALCLDRAGALRFLEDGPFEQLLKGFDPAPLAETIAAACLLFENDPALREIEINPLAILDATGRCNALDVLMAVGNPT